MISLKNIWLCLFIIYFNSCESSAYRILVVSPFNSKSHNNMLESVAKALALKGHQVDVISHFVLKNPPKNYKTIINLDGTMKEHVNTWTKEMVDYFRDVDIVSTIINEFGNNYCELMSVERFQKFIKNPPKDPPYDLVITEALAANCYFGIGHILKVPVVLVSGLVEFPWVDDIIGNPTSTALAVSMGTKSGSVSGFWDRVKNTFQARYGNYRFFLYTEKYQTEVMRKYLSPNIPSIREIENNVALLLVNSYHSFFGIRPMTPAVVQVAGLQIELSDTKLTPELKTWMDESVRGVVFFTLGSMVIIEDFPEDVLLGLYASFAKLAPTRVLMKIVKKEKLPPGLPDNVLTMSWIPQIAVLRHNNTRLFMTHGGLNSVQEALYYGVPMIGFPLFGDQTLNINLMTAKNVAYEIDYREMSEKTVDVALRAVLNDPKYRKAARHESHLFRDRPMTATDTTVFWVEYIIRHGANSLRSPAMDMHWWQAELLDVYGFFLICILAISYLTLFILRKIICVICHILNFNPQRHKKTD